MSDAEVRDLSAQELRVGLSAEFERTIGAEDIAAFAHLSGDENPLHLSEEYASQTNYGRRIVHGAFQISLASALLGMHLPGKRVVLGSVRSRFMAPLYYPCSVVVRGEIVSWLPDRQSGVLRVHVRDKATSSVTAEVQMGFGLHEGRANAQTAAVQPRSGDPRELVVVTGASGALGRALSSHLLQRYDVLGLARAGASAGNPAAAALVACDLEDEDWESRASDALAGRSVYAVVHAAWPGAPKGGLLELDLETVRRQLDFGGVGTVRLARWLSRHALPEARLVLLGSTAGTLYPELGLAAYSLGKVTLEHALRLLAPELAARGISINAILPSYMPVGINQAKTERATLLETARVPAGRLCTPEDVIACVDYLLSPGASFVSGQLLPLTGGRL
jgi:NAD(P)-dependent dehydrogenase (short-subunit alcohol dehydrogenase family)/acyl dehydratase